MKPFLLATLLLVNSAGSLAGPESFDAELIGTPPSEQILIGGASAFKLYWKVERLGRPVEKTRSVAVWRYKNITCELIVPFPREQAEIGDAICHMAISNSDRKSP